jgi:hypothetical protein
MKDEIKYKSHPNDNTKEVYDFIGKQPECEICGGYGEYESDYCPKGCNPCNSRLIAFIDKNGVLSYADWGDIIIKDNDGLSLILGHEHD